MKLPLKARIFQYAVQQQNEFTMKQVMQDLAKEYASESIFSEKQVEEYFDSFLGVGFFKATRTEFDADGKLVIYCVVTDYGRKRSKYVAA